MVASAATGADDSNGKIVRLAATKERRRAASLQVLMGLLNTAQAEGRRDQAEALIAAIYERCDAAMVSNTREAGTP